MDDLEKFTRLKAKVASMAREADKARGALDRIMEQLNEEFGCSSVKQAEKLLAKLEREREEAERTARRALKKFEEEWGGFLERT